MGRNGTKLDRMYRLLTKMGGKNKPREVRISACLIGAAIDNSGHEGVEINRDGGSDGPYSDTKYRYSSIFTIWRKYRYLRQEVANFDTEPTVF